MILTYLPRTLKCFAVAVAFLCAMAVTALGRRSWGPKLLRWFFQTSGGGFVKFGQLLAMRYDSLPPAYCEELAGLFDQIPSAPYREILRIVERDLGPALGRLVREIDPQPVGSASIAQAHAATLVDGQRVILKVKRPGIDRDFAIDLLNLRLLARFLDFTRWFSPVRMMDLVKEISHVIRYELDFRREARFAHFIHQKLLADDLDHYAPRVCFELSGVSVITMERLEGVWMQELVQAVRNQDHDLLEAWAERGIRPHRVGKLLLRSVLQQVFHHRVFHADPHAGNLVVLDGGTLGFIDFGIVGQLDERLCARQARIYKHLTEGSVNAAYEAVLDTVEPIPRGDLTGLEEAIKDLLWTWVISSQSPNATIGDRSSGELVLRIADILRRYGLKLPWRFLIMHRTTLLADSLVYTLNPRLDPSRTTQAFFRREVSRRRSKLLAPSQLLDSFLTALEVGASLPATAQRLLYWLDFHLPELGRKYAQQLSKIEQMILLGLRFARRFAWVVAAFLVFAGGWGELPSPVREYRWVGAGVAGLTAFLLGRLEERLLELD